MDSALRALIERETGTRDVEVVFDAPTRDWAGRRNSPTIDVYLYDIREDLRRRERGVLNEYNADQTRIVGRHLPPRHFKLSYLITAWTQRPEDEHRLLSSLLMCFLRFDALPPELLGGPLAALGLPVPVTVALPPPEDRAFADVWSALGGELKPSIDVVVSTPMDTGQQFEVGPAITRPPLFGMSGLGGWPDREEAGFVLGEGDQLEGRAGDAPTGVTGARGADGRGADGRGADGRGADGRGATGSGPAGESRVSLRRRGMRLGQKPPSKKP